MKTPSRYLQIVGLWFGRFIRMFDVVVFSGGGLNWVKENRLFVPLIWKESASSNVAPR